MSRRVLTITVAMTFAAMLTGCHTAKVLLPPNLRPPSKDAGNALKLAKQQLQNATPCCSSFADFSYRTMLPWQPKKFTLGNGSMVANLDGTHSYFLAFRLPTALKMPYRIAMKSELNGRWLKESYLFAPTIVLLDSGFQQIVSKNVGLCEHMGWSDETTGAFGSIKIDDERARYLLVYSSAAQQSGKTYWEQSPASISNTSAASLQMSSSGSFSVPHGPNGSLWVGMMNTTYAKTIDAAICQKATEGDGLLNTLRTALPLPWNNASNGTSGTSGTSGGSSGSNKDSLIDNGKADHGNTK